MIFGLKEKDIEVYFDRLFCINRSLTGNGNRETLKILSDLVDINLIEVPSGTSCFDWTIPEEWNVNEAWIKDKDGNMVIDFSNLNLHLLGYSEPVHQKMTLDVLKEHLYSIPEQPDAIPYLTSYYQKRWGFCLSDNQLKGLKEGTYEVYIDSSFNPQGSMTIGEAFLKGKSNKEVLLTTYICHPSLANNELSGPLVSAFLYQMLKQNQDNLRYSYRFLYLPETIGTIYYLSQWGEYFKQNLIAGYVLTCLGDGGNFTYKKSRRGNTIGDRAVKLLFRQNQIECNELDFFPSGGSDERQYCSPGFDLPVGSLMRTMYGKYKEYHTSLDNKSFISFKAMKESVEYYYKLLRIIDTNYFYLNTNPYCEPQLGKRGLYPTLGSQKKKQSEISVMMWLLNLADGNNDLISIAEKSGCDYDLLCQKAQELMSNNLLKYSDAKY